MKDCIDKGYDTRCIRSTKQCEFQCVSHIKYDMNSIGSTNIFHFGMSEALIKWHIDQHVEPNVYRLNYFGNERNFS